MSPSTGTPRPGKGAGGPSWERVGDTTEGCWGRERGEIREFFWGQEDGTNRRHQGVLLGKDKGESLLFLGNETKRIEDTRKVSKGGEKEDIPSFYRQENVTNDMQQGGLLE